MVLDQESYFGHQLLIPLGFLLGGLHTNLPNVTQNFFFPLRCTQNRQDYAKNMPIDEVDRWAEIG